MTTFRYVQSYNAKSSFRIGMTSLAAHTPAEYAALLAPLNVPTVPPSRHTGDPPPDALDRRNTSYVPPVADSGDCTSWPFASVVPLSHIYFQAHAEKVQFSAQNLIDCVTVNKGCEGGNTKQGWDYVIAHQGGKVPSSDSYPFVFPSSQACKFSDTEALSVLTKAVPVGLGNETDLLNSVAAYGPVVVGMDASSVAFQLYVSGVFEDNTCSSVLVNHEMAVVGYGSYGETPYWIVQNSWGAAWGEQGYIRIIRGKNLCGIATFAVHAE
jgi:C1A family cysteine protease